ncbi:hypothetical protein ACQWF4_22480, partial [Salmonella enterica subsp. enterica serovar Infantis]
MMKARMLKKKSNDALGVAIARYSSDKAPARCFKTITKGALFVLTKRYTDNQITTVRKKKRQMT